MLFTDPSPPNKSLQLLHGFRLSSSSFDETSTSCVCFWPEFVRLTVSDTGQTRCSYIGQVYGLEGGGQVQSHWTINVWRRNIGQVYGLGGIFGLTQALESVYGFDVQTKLLSANLGWEVWSRRKVGEGRKEKCWKASPLKIHLQSLQLWLQDLESALLESEKYSLQRNVVYKTMYMWRKREKCGRNRKHMGEEKDYVGEEKTCGDSCNFWPVNNWVGNYVDYKFKV